MLLTYATVIGCSRRPSRYDQTSQSDPETWPSATPPGDASRRSGLDRRQKEAVVAPAPVDGEAQRSSL